MGAVYLQSQPRQFVQIKLFSQFWAFKFMFMWTCFTATEILCCAAHRREESSFQTGCWRRLKRGRRAKDTAGCLAVVDAQERKRAGLGTITALSGRVGDALLFPSHAVMLATSPLKNVQIAGRGAQAVFTMLSKHSGCWVFMTTDDVFQERPSTDVHPEEMYLLDTQINV